MPSWMCKIFRFLLNVAEVTIESIAGAINTVGNAVWDVLENVIDGAGGLFGNILGKPALLFGLGIAGYLIFTNSDEEKERGQPVN